MPDSMNDEEKRVASIRAAATPATQLLAEHAIRNGNSLEWFLGGYKDVATRDAANARYEEERQATEQAAENEWNTRLRYWQTFVKSNILARSLANNGLSDVSEVTWDRLVALERQKNNNWGKHKSALVAAALGLPSRPAPSLDRAQRIEAALRAMVRHADALIKVGAWQHFVELERAKEALKR